MKKMMIGRNRAYSKFPFYVLIIHIYSIVVLSEGTTKPHIVFVLVDDLGNFAPSYNNPELHTPTLLSLAENGLILEDHYTYRFCSPSRGALLTGRFPYKLSGTRNNYRPSSVLDGVDLSYSFLPQQLKSAGYINYHIGKWHLGFYDVQYTPINRGFHYTDGYLVGAQDHYQQLNNQTFDKGACDQFKGPPQFFDLWNGEYCSSSSSSSGGIVDRDVDIPENRMRYETSSSGANAYQSSTLCNSNRGQTQGTYNSFRFASRAVEHIHNHAQNHGADTPLFMYLALQNTHKPLQPPPSKYLDLYPNITYMPQKIFYAMISVVDDVVRNVTAALKANGFWENTLLIWVSDNGSPVDGGGSNYPLKGSKSSNWEGGVRTPAFISGGLLPAAQQNKRLRGLIHLVDWYTTVLGLANVPAIDNGVSSIDGLDMWPWLSGRQEGAESPRQIIVHDHYLYDGPQAWGALRMKQYKMVVGPHNYSSWYGGPENNYYTPNASVPEPDVTITSCSYSSPCLYNIEEDPTEHYDISLQYPDVLSDMMNYWNHLYSQYHPPVDTPKTDNTGYCKQAQQNNWYVTPWYNTSNGHVENSSNTNESDNNNTNEIGLAIALVGVFLLFSYGFYISRELIWTTMSTIRLYITRYFRQRDGYGSALQEDLGNSEAEENYSGDNAWWKKNNNINISMTHSSL